MIRLAPSHDSRRAPATMRLAARSATDRRPADFAHAHDPARTRARAAACRVSADVVADAARACARGEAALQTVLRDRLQWRAWQAGLAALYRRPAGAPVSPLRVCMYCAAVCFPPSAHDNEAGPAATGETWIDAPEVIRDDWLATGRGPERSHGVCQRCLPTLHAALGDVGPADAPGAAGASHDAQGAHGA